MTLKLFLRYPFERVRANRILKKKKPCHAELSERPLVLDLKTTQLMFDGGRHLFSIAYHAAECGSPTQLRCNQMLLTGIVHKVYGRAMVSEDFVSYQSNTTPITHGSLVLSDQPLKDHQQRDITKRNLRHLHLKIGRDLPKDPPVMPYPMHPWTLRELPTQSLDGMRETQRKKCLVLFAGCQRPKYGSPWMENEFNILNRLDVLATVRSHFAPRVLDQFPNGSSSQLSENKSVDSMVFLDSAKSTISASDWLPTLAMARFFLCGPGGRQPICHHLTEAMSVGTIPILEYGDRVHPNLEDGINAIRFQGREGLVDAINRVISMPVSEQKAMSQRVVSFYEQNLSGKSFMQRLLRNEIRGEELAMPFHELNFY